MFQLCAPASIYLFISLLDIIFNAYVRLYNHLFIKTIVVLSVTLFLNILCEKGFSEISWLIVLLAFIVIVIILLNNQGCSRYNIPANHLSVMVKVIPIDNAKPLDKVPATNDVPVKQYYEHIPYGRSDPAYQS
jgi:hypothetical protein